MTPNPCLPHSFCHVSLLSGNEQSSGDYETALADAEAAIAILDGSMQCDEKMLIKAHDRRVSFALSPSIVLCATFVNGS